MKDCTFNIIEKCFLHAYALYKANFSIMKTYNTRLNIHTTRLSALEKFIRSLVFYFLMLTCLHAKQV